MGLLADKNFKEFYEDQALRVGNKIISDSLKIKYRWIVSQICEYSEGGLNILDVGCQAGGLSIILAMMGHCCTGVDISQNYLKYARQNATNNKVAVRWICSSVQDLNHSLGSHTCRFDVVVLSSILEHVLEEDIARILHQCKNVIEGKHLFLAIVPDGKSFYSKDHVTIFDYEKVRRYFPSTEIERLKCTSRNGWFTIKEVV